MWHFFKKEPTKKPVEFIGVDMHSHLLPAVDDGVKTINESCHFLKDFHDLGFNKVHCTPHIYKDFYPNTKKGLTKEFNQFIKSKELNSLELEVLLASEYYLDEHFSSLLDANEMLTCGENYVLVETSFAGLPMNLQDSLFNITMAGYTPVLAHPERYQYLATRLKVFNQLVEQGVKLQVNLTSIAGYYGKIPMDIFNYLLKEDLISFLGTDLHHQDHMNALTVLANDSKLLKKLRKINLLNQTL